MNRFLAKFVGDVEPKRGGDPSAKAHQRDSSSSSSSAAAAATAFAARPGSNTSATSTTGAIASPRTQEYLDHLDEIPLSTNSPIAQRKAVQEQHDPYSQQHHQQQQQQPQASYQHAQYTETSSYQYDNADHHHHHHHHQQQQQQQPGYAGYDGYYGGQDGYDQQYYSGHQQDQFYGADANAHSYYHQQPDHSAGGLQHQQQEYVAQEANWFDQQQQASQPYETTHGDSQMATPPVPPFQVTDASSVFDQPPQAPAAVSFSGSPDQNVFNDTPFSGGANDFFGSPTVGGFPMQQPQPQHQQQQQQQQEQPLGFGFGQVQQQHEQPDPFTQDASALFGAAVADGMTQASPRKSPKHEPSAFSPSPPMAKQSITTASAAASPVPGLDQQSAPFLHDALSESPKNTSTEDFATPASPSSFALDAVSPRLKVKVSPPSSPLVQKKSPSGSPTRQQQSPRPLHQPLAELDLTAASSPLSAATTATAPGTAAAAFGTTFPTSLSSPKRADKDAVASSAPVVVTSPTHQSPDRARLRKNSSTTLDDATQLMEMYKQMAERLEVEKTQLLTIIASQTDELERIKAKFKSVSLSAAGSGRRQSQEVCSSHSVQAP